MAELIKSVLLVDYESVQRSLVGTVGETRLAERSAAWLAALEAGRLGPDVKRTLMVKRCYVTPSVRGKPRDLLIAAGFDMVDAVDAGARSSADLHMAMDTIDALAKPEGYQEFILLSAAAELAPLLSRLKANKRVTVIYADPATPAGDRQLADAIIETSDLVRVLTGEPTPVGEISVPAGASSPRADIEAFARRIHAATSIPLFSPKTFAELFRQLTEEIAANGYHFQTTARNVADRMVAGGRNVTRRQVVFIVKGLALKGHVFSTSDTADKLAEVFREQAHYLITNAGITLNQHEEDLLTAWFLSRPPTAAPPLAPASGAPPPQPAAAAPPTPPAPPTVPEASSDAKATIAETIEREVAKAVARQPPQAERVPIRPPQPQQPQAQPPRPNATNQQKTPQVKVEMPKSAARPPPLPSAREEAKAVIAARIAGAARMKPAGTRTPIPAKPAPKAPAPPAEPEPEPVANEAAAPLPADGPKSDALENSILAAIAEAVDVLVEDSGDEDEHAPEPLPPPPREPQGKKRANQSAPPPPRQPDPEPPSPPEAEEDIGESNDIGDQIQRIIASYNRNRSDE
ncbi:MAG: NYN domain-containing protein [Bauldia sp.]